jgi:hypothetical protein
LRFLPPDNFNSGRRKTEMGGQCRYYFSVGFTFGRRGGDSNFILSRTYFLYAGLTSAGLDFDV